MTNQALATASGIRRISEERTQWRVMVETWPDEDGYHGRFVFSPDGGLGDTREGPAALRGSTREEVIAEAYDLPEDRLKQVLRSLM